MVCECDRKAAECFSRNYAKYASGFKGFCPTKNITDEQCYDKILKSINTPFKAQGVFQTLPKKKYDINQNLKSNSRNVPVRNSMSMLTKSNDLRLICGAGSFSNYERTQCIKCKPGTAESSSGTSCNYASGCSCIKCSYGIAPNEGSTSCSNCPAGTVPDDNRTSCLKL